jgi:hypothetical protein
MLQRNGDTFSGPIKVENLGKLFDTECAPRLLYGKDNLYSGVETFSEPAELLFSPVQAADQDWRFFWSEMLGLATYESSGEDAKRDVTRNVA